MDSSAKTSDRAGNRQDQCRVKMAETVDVDSRIRNVAAALGRHAAQQYYKQACSKEEKRPESEGQLIGRFMLLVALCARYSSDNQRDASIEDQLRLCRERTEGENWRVADSYSDRSMSGASLNRPSIQALLQNAQAGRFDILLAESLDRILRACSRRCAARAACRRRPPNAWSSNWQEKPRRDGARWTAVQCCPTSSAALSSAMEVKSPKRRPKARLKRSSQRLE